MAKKKVYTLGMAEFVDVPPDAEVVTFLGSQKDAAVELAALPDEDITALIRMIRKTRDIQPPTSSGGRAKKPVYKPDPSDPPAPSNEEGGPPARD